MNDHSLDAAGSGKGQLRVHFWLADHSHRMDALVLNKCEAALIGLVREVGRQLDVDFSVETSAYGEGGLTVFLEFLGKHAAALQTIGVVAAAIASSGVWIAYQPALLRQQIEQNDFALKRDRKLAEQQIELNELALKRARIELKRMEAENEGKPATGTNADLPLEPAMSPENMVAPLLSVRKISMLRSDFYVPLLGYARVSAVGFSPRHAAPVDEEIVVPRDQFSQYVLELDAEEIDTIPGVAIEVVAPVLNGSAERWRGVLEGRGISFEVADESFLRKVVGKKIKFQNGTTLFCDLEVRSKSTVLGDTGKPSFRVCRVLRIAKAQTKPGPPVPPVGSSDGQSPLEFGTRA